MSKQPSERLRVLRTKEVRTQDLIACSLCRATSPHRYHVRSDPTFDWLLAAACADADGQSAPWFDEKMPPKTVFATSSRIDGSLWIAAVNSSSSIKPFLDVSTLLKKFSVARLHTSTVSTEAVRPSTLSTLKVPCFATSSCLPEGLELCVHSTFILQAEGDVYGVGYPHQAAPAE